MAYKEVLFIGDKSGLLQCVDPLIGTIFLTYRGVSSVSKNTLSVIGNDYLIAADGIKPLLTVWPLNSQEQLSGPKLVIAGKASAVSVSRDGYHTAVAIDSKINVYGNTTGTFLGILDKHYLGISKLLFLDDSSHLVSCGENGTVLVWNIATAINVHGNASLDNSENEPLYTFSHHALPVTDAYAGPGGIKGRLYTASQDQTVKVYNLKDGTMLLSVGFEISLTSLHPNPIETELYLGASNGKILVYSLDPLPRSLEYAPSDDDAKKPFEGHEKAVTCLQVLVSGQTLVSGSDDGKVIVWDIVSRQLLKLFVMKGEVSSIILNPAVDNIFCQNFEPSISFQNFKRVLSDDDFEVSVIVQDSLIPIDYGVETEEIVIVEAKNDSEDVETLKLELAKVVQKNKELYQFAMERVLSDPLGFGDGAERRKKLKKKESF